MTTEYKEKLTKKIINFLVDEQPETDQEFHVYYDKSDKQFKFYQVGVPVSDKSIFVRVGTVGKINLETIPELKDKDKIKDSKFVKDILIQKALLEDWYHAMLEILDAELKKK